MTTAMTPAAQGYRMPAEWDPHDATWIGWPHYRRDWRGKLATVHWVFAEMVRKLAPGERIRLLVHSAGAGMQARHLLARAGVDLRRVEFVRQPTDRGWTRDTGPVFVTRQTPRPGRAIVDFHFNAWALYRNWSQDRRIAARASRRLRLPLFDAAVDGRRLTLEGGGIEVNGRGTAITTEECYLDPAVQVRNPGLDRAGFEGALREYLGAGNVIWLGRGLAGDDTHGHVDDLCRFVGPRTLVLARETDARDTNHRPLAENRERLEGARLEDGTRPEVVYLPMPAPLMIDGRRLPASYANFYIGNAAVIVPTFNDPNDRVALGILGELFRDRPVVGIHAVDLVIGRGTLHCLTQQEPAARPGTRRTA